MGKVNRAVAAPNPNPREHETHIHTTGWPNASTLLVHLEGHLPRSTYAHTQEEIQCAKSREQRWARWPMKMWLSDCGCSNKDNLSVETCQHNCGRMTEAIRERQTAFAYEACYRNDRISSTSKALDPTTVKCTLLQMPPSAMHAGAWAGNRKSLKTKNLLLNNICCTKMCCWTIFCRWCNQTYYIHHNKNGLLKWSMRLVAWVWCALWLGGSNSSCPIWCKTHG